MLASKVFITTALLSSGGAAMVKKQQAQTVRSECAERGQTAAEQGAADLDQIFNAAAAEGGIPPDPEEIQELLLKAQGRTIRYVKANVITI